MNKKDIKDMEGHITLGDSEKEDFCKTIQNLKGLENYFKIKIHKNKWDKPILELVKWLIDNTETVLDLPLHSIDKSYILANVKDFRDLFLCFRDKEDKKLYFLKCKIKKTEIVKLLSKVVDYYEISHNKDNEFKFFFPQEPFCALTQTK